MKKRMLWSTRSDKDGDLMKLIRLTFAGKGIFKVLRDLDDIGIEPWDEQDLYDAERDFEEILKIPDACTMLAQTKSYFTEKGYERFEESIETLTFIINNYLGGKDWVKTEEIEAAEGDLLYLDEYQAVLAV